MGLPPVLGKDEQNTMRESCASDFKCSSPSQTLSGRSFSHSSSGLSTLSWAKLRCRLCECQSPWTMVKAGRVMIRSGCKAHVSSSTFLSKCWGRGSWAWAECQHSLQFNPNPQRNKLLSSLHASVYPLSHIWNSLTTSKQNISKEHFRNVFSFVSWKHWWEEKPFCVLCKEPFNVSALSALFCSFTFPEVSLRVRPIVLSPRKAENLRALHWRWGSLGNGQSTGHRKKTQPTNIKATPRG